MTARPSRRGEGRLCGNPRTWPPPGGAPAGRATGSAGTSAAEAARHRHRLGGGALGQHRRDLAGDRAHVPEYVPRARRRPRTGLGENRSPSSRARGLARRGDWRSNAAGSGGHPLMPITLHLDLMLVRRKVKSNELAKAIGITESNLSAIKSGRIKGIRFSTLESICAYLRCQPGDILEYVSDDRDETERVSRVG